MTIRKAINVGGNAEILRGREAIVRWSLSLVVDNDEKEEWDAH